MNHLGVISLSICLLLASNLSKGEATPAQSALLEHFLLLNQDGEEAPPPELKASGCPFGTMITFEGNSTKSPTYNTVSRIGDYAVTSAHGLDSQSQSNHFIVYFDSEGKKRVGVVSNVAYFDREKDIAVFNLGEPERKSWTPFDAALAHFPHSSSNPTQQSIAAQVWASDPLDRRFDVLTKLIDKHDLIKKSANPDPDTGEPVFHGAVLQVRDWTAVDRFAPLAGPQVAEVPLHSHEIGFEHASSDSDIGAFPGNSGSLVVSSGQGKPKILGIYRRRAFLKLDTSDIFWHHRADGSLSPLTAGDVFGGVGTSLFLVAKAHPVLRSQVENPKELICSDALRQLAAGEHPIVKF